MFIMSVYFFIAIIIGLLLQARFSPTTFSCQLREHIAVSHHTSNSNEAEQILVSNKCFDATLYKCYEVT